MCKPPNHLLQGEIVQFGSHKVLVIISVLFGLKCIKFLFYQLRSSECGVGFGSPLACDNVTFYPKLSKTVTRYLSLVTGGSPPV